MEKEIEHQFASRALMDFILINSVRCDLEAIAKSMMSCVI